VLTRAYGFFTSPGFLHHPIRSVSRGVVWHAHWRLRCPKPFTVEYANGLKLTLAQSSASSGVYLNHGFSDAMVPRAPRGIAVQQLAFRGPQACFRSKASRANRGTQSV